MTPDLWNISTCVFTFLIFFFHLYRWSTKKTRPASRSTTRKSFRTICSSAESVSGTRNSTRRASWKWKEIRCGFFIIIFFSVIGSDRDRATALVDYTFLYCAMYVVLRALLRPLIQRHVNNSSITVLSCIFIDQVLLDLARMIFEEQSTIEHMVFRILTHTQSLIQCQRVQVREQSLLFHFIRVIVSCWGRKSFARTRFYYYFTRDLTTRKRSKLCFYFYLMSNYSKICK